MPNSTHTAISRLARFATLGEELCIEFDKMRMADELSPALMVSEVAAFFGDELADLYNDWMDEQVD